MGEIVKRVCVCVRRYAGISDGGISEGSVCVCVCVRRYGGISDGGISEGSVCVRRYGGIS